MFCYVLDAKHVAPIPSWAFPTLLATAPANLQSLSWTIYRVVSPTGPTHYGRARAYLEAVEGTFGGDVDYAQLIKTRQPYPCAGALLCVLNFYRIHKMLRMSPVMAAGVTDRLWSLEDIVAKIDAMAPAPKPRGPYRKRGGQ